MSGDLHCHTRLSNGSMGIDEIIMLSGKNGIDTIAVMDHDCIAGNMRARMIGERKGVRVLPGVEISALDDKSGRIVHVLCYLPENTDRLEGICHANTLARTKASQYMMLKTTKLYPVSGELIKRCAQGSTNLFEEHILQAFMESGLSLSLYSDIAGELFGEGEKSVFVKPQFTPLSVVISTIHAAEGIAVLAHPVQSGLTDILDDLIAMGFDGIEVWHPSADEEATALLTAKAKAKKLLMTGGSDFHGLYNRYPVTIGSYITPKAQLSELMGYKMKQKRLAKKQAAEAQPE